MDTSDAAQRKEAMKEQDELMEMIGQKLESMDLDGVWILIQESHEAADFECSKYIWDNQENAECEYA